MNRIARAQVGCIALCALAAIPRAVLAIGGQFGVEFAIDAPWRLEPTPLGGDRYTYPPIPITIAFHDTLFEEGRGFVTELALPKISVGKLVGIRVEEIGTNQPPVTDIPVSAMEEIEVKRGLSTRSGEPRHDVCRPSLGQDCRALLAITDSHEWHGAFWFTPRTPVTPGRNIQLKVTVRTLTTVKILAPGAATVPPSYLVREVPKEWTNYLVVHAGETPLPRFGPEWLYGDVHYHSQMTDNEGESAYSYRNVARALGATGFDFVFATDHASNSDQVDGHADGRIEARDLNRARFAAAKGILYAPDGVNRLIAEEAARVRLPRVTGPGILPQVYMGEEIDAWPEMSAGEFTDGKIRYGDRGLHGDGLKYDWLWKQKGFISCNTGSSNYDRCKALYGRPESPAKATYLLWDDQGIPISQKIDEYAAPLGGAINQNEWIPDSVEPYPSRQHIVYFPVDASLRVTGWIGSDTGRFGGASKRLQNIVGEIEANGFAFLAHPVEESEPGSIAGPDIVPYSDTALTRAWSSPAILGLQFWNENDRYRSGPAGIDPTVVVEKVDVSGGIITGVSYRYRWPFPGDGPEGSSWRWKQAGQLHRNVMSGTFHKLHHGAATWDRYLRKGLDPSQTASLGWLTTGEPRKWFMAGGSDAHGDWDYRRYGRPDPLKRWSDYPVGDTAIGNPRNLVSTKEPTSGQSAGVASETTAPASGPRRYANREVIEAFRAGRFTVTDGPALRIAVDKNRNGAIDDSDFQMGSTFHFFPGEHIPLLVEWFSTPEFGPIEQIDLYVGNAAGTFASKRHGTRILPFYTEDYGGYQHDPEGVLQIRLADGDGGFNRPDLPASVGYHGVAKVFLGPGQFQLAAADQALFYVRAFARTITDAQGQAIGACPEVGAAGSKCGDRFAFSNPIWGKYRVTCPPPGRTGATRGTGGTALTTVSTPYLDADDDGGPDVCERDIPDPCADPRRPVGGLGGVLVEGTRLDRGAGTHVDTSGTGRPPVATEEALATPRPAKPIPDRSCQVLRPAA